MATLLTPLTVHCTFSVNRGGKRFRRAHPGWFGCHLWTVVCIHRKLTPAKTKSSRDTSVPVRALLVIIVLILLSLLLTIRSFIIVIVVHCWSEIRMCFYYLMYFWLKTLFILFPTGIIKYLLIELECFKSRKCKFNTFTVSTVEFNKNCWN